ncbi:MAG: NAD(P)-binding domain-containing protein [Nitrospinota bacterium]|nr:NAD(P)-binding domain-containing protein [Nitrospinota bacterium]
MKNFKTIGILSPGDMGHSVGKEFKENGFSIVTCLKGRSSLTKNYAKSVGFVSLKTYREVLEESDIVFSILPPKKSFTLANQIAKEMTKVKSNPIYVDCNAISPKNARKINKTITEAGCAFIDSGIIGPPPRNTNITKFYVSGLQLDKLKVLETKRIKICPIGREVGRASAMKMCYASLTKGTRALHAAVITVAEKLGLSEELKKEFLFSQKEIYEMMQKTQPRLPSVSGRWIGEMEEIADTFKEEGISPFFHLAAASIYKMMQNSPLSKEKSDNFNAKRSLKELAKIYAKTIN